MVTARHRLCHWGLQGCLGACSPECKGCQGQLAHGHGVQPCLGGQAQTLVRQEATYDVGYCPREEQGLQFNMCLLVGRL